jgi:DNA replication licensing factor MCM4
MAPSPQVRPFNLETPRTIRDLNPEDIDTLVSVQGMVTRTSTIIPELRWEGRREGLCVKLWRERCT